jgi:cysteine synthase A
MPKRKGLLRPGGVIVEGTAGNTGIGLALVAQALGYRTVIVIPETQSQEKKDALKLLGAELVEVPAVPYKNPNNYVKLSGRLAEQLAKTEPNGAIWANQFDNVANRQAHIETTAPEIWADTDGKVDGFICAVGSGGTLAGVAAGLKGFNPTSRSASPIRRVRRSTNSTRPWRAEIGRWFDHRRHRPGPHHRQSRRLHAGFRLPDPGCRSAAATSSIWSRMKGSASAARPASTSPAPIRLAKDLGPGHTIVTILCDYGNRYQSKLFNPDF